MRLLFTPGIPRLLGLSLLLTARLAAATDERVTFNEHIRPILSDNCFACHGQDEKKREGKLRLDTAAGATTKREGLPAITPGDPEKSELWWRINSKDPDELMPPADSHKPPLTAAQRALLKRWIEQGAVYQRHWAFEPIARPEVPRAEKAQSAVDAFVLKKLAAHHLTLSPEADREALVRRVTLDLTGLPPTVAEIDAFLADNSPDAYERVVDRLLASVRYGEHFGRHWLDAVRYADTHGLHLDNERTIWPYRDWVVRAFNANLPFDQFIVQQLAGDLLPNPTVDQLLASGFNRNHLTTGEGGSIEEEVEARNTGDRADTTASVFLGLTANCASCHDHKFDPLAQKEYYQFGAFFKGLTDHTIDANYHSPPPRVLVADAATHKRLVTLAAALPPLDAALTARADALAATTPVIERPERKPIRYEVVWAEDGDLPTSAQAAPGARPLAGEWRGGPDVPTAGGERALRLEGRVERPLAFTAGDVPLALKTKVKAFVHFRADKENPPRAVGLELIAESGRTRRFIWGDASAFAPEFAATALPAGPLPAPGTYARLEIDACDAGLAVDARYTGLRIAQSDGAAWWDRAGTVCTSPSAADDPVLSKDAWIRAVRDDKSFKDAPVPLDIKFLVNLSSTFQSPAEKKKLANWWRDYVYGPLRAALEPEAHAARRVLAEQVYHEATLPSSLISGERAEPLPQHVLIRGQYDKRGERVAAATPAFLPPLEVKGPRATRLDLARWIASPQNPLAARVAANRFWAQLFGAGLVRTTTDFGVQGETPTHLALLDWLASEFIGTGWDVKRLVRTIVTSRTYRQDTRATPALLELDPQNKLLARAPRLRLEAEVLRDQALALSGLLVPTLGGPPVKPYQPPNIWEPVGFVGSNTRVYMQDHGAALYRRSLYTFWKRTAPPPSMATFDAPSREIVCIGRGRSNTPLQALVLMNDVQHFEAARGFASQLLTADARDDAARLELGFRSVTARRPTPDERTWLAAALARHRAHYAKDPEAARKTIANGESPPNASLAPTELAAWTLIANLLLNLDEAVARN